MEFIKQLFTGIMTTQKLAKSVDKNTKQIMSSVKQGDIESLRNAISEVIKFTHAEVADSDLEIGEKNSFYAGFLGGIYGEMYNVLGKPSGNDIKKFIGWPDEVHIIAYRAHKGQRQPLMMSLGF